MQSRYNTGTLYRVAQNY